MIREKIRIGFTQREGRDYIPSFDGYRPGARQVTVEIGPLDIPGLAEGFPPGFEEAAMVAEACYVAMNAPTDVTITVLAGEIRHLLEVGLADPRYTDPESVLWVHNLQIGDTVTVGTVTVSCEKAGWRQR